MCTLLTSLMHACPAFVCPSTTSDCVVGGDAFQFSGAAAAKADVKALEVALQLRESGGIASLVESVQASQC